MTLVEQVLSAFRFHEDVRAMNFNKKDIFVEIEFRNLDLDGVGFKHRVEIPNRHYPISVKIIRRIEDDDQSG